MTIQLYLVRHGETPMNQNNQLQGITDMPLTPKGRQQAQATAALLAGVPFSAAYSSDRLRAVDTAEIILAEHPSVVLHRRAGLREYYFGGLEGVTNNQLISASLARYGVKTMTHAWTRGERFAQLIRNFEKMDHTKQAESLPELRLRVQTSFAQIVAAQPDDAKVLVVAHGVFLSAMVDLIAPEKLPATLLKNASVTRLDVADGAWQVRGVNLTSASELAKADA
ncbi:histidine phosphatase family protein [Lacticaseibacillus manihotivorans]|jgi:probable phosphoglycerate mutase|uniref:Phosphoglycerate mutase n=2 Tax=Lacticaseibacillus manihotivorans TaxID=88233 RepID=A0A0R1R5Z3_9LACO|nr:histidine phosphatase family protein [Lacticaseibacillus manihotivorans]KRL52454.1 phosphoglycerate mutase [Lacticaseibacillus manihotivorans DSM 13343 = JCM 12514]QFQ92021.1 histidine phosphatase family protein [Lacticaseibacillus manihotivorans]